MGYFSRFAGYAILAVLFMGLLPHPAFCQTSTTTSTVGPTTTTTTLAGKVWYVKANAAGANTGVSWANAFTLLESGLQAAQSGDEIWIAAGTYKPTNHYGLGTADPRLVHFRMKNNVAIYGGFAGNETLRSQRNISANVVILSGDIGVTGNNADNCYHVFCHPSELGLDATALLDGVTVCGGNANGLNWPHYAGGGMYNEYSSPALTNCIFSGNSALNGGGTYNSRSSPTLTNCTFSGNSASSSGGGIVNLYDSFSTVTGCSFSGNTAAYDAGGVYNYRSCSAALTNCTFSANRAERNGGAMYNNGSSITLTNCAFSGNSASYGGGLYNENSSSALTNSILWGNTAASHGPQMYGESSTPTVSCSDIQGGYTGTGNINADPLFVNSGAGDFRLRAGSPCIDAANGDAAPPADRDGNSRHDDTGKVNTGSGAPAFTDIGAYEFQGTTPPTKLTVKSWPMTGQVIGSSTGHGGRTEYCVTGVASGTSIALTAPASDPIGYVFVRWETNGNGQAEGVKSLTFALGPDTVALARYSPPVVFVKADATGANNGTSWTDAFTSLESALQAVGPGCEIWIAAGTYRPSNDYGLDTSDPRLVHFRMKNGVGIYGGFAGNETLRSQRNVSVNLVILSGDIGVTGDSSDNCYHVFYHPDTFALTGSAVLDGVTISGGNADASKGVHGCGGGMYNESSSPALANCAFGGNSAAYSGAGMYNSSSSPALTNCTFSSNNAYRDGGGMYNCAFSAPTVTDCTFSANSATRDGGGLSNMSSSPTLTNCAFTGNSTGDRGGGMGSSSCSSPTLFNCIFVSNSASNSGGGILSDTPPAALANCILWGNTAPNYPQIANYNDTAIVVYSDVQGGYTGTGNINSDPLFVNAGAGNFRLRAGSPCIDAGTATGAPATDKDGQGRYDDPATVNTGAGTPNCVDIGAYEYQGNNTTTTTRPTTTTSTTLRPTTTSSTTTTTSTTTRTSTTTSTLRTTTTTLPATITTTTASSTTTRTTTSTMGTTTTVTLLPHPSDANHDFRIIIGEMTAYGAAWKKGQTWPEGPVPIPIGYVTRAGYLWRMGEAYHYDRTADPAVWPTNPMVWVTGR